MKRYRESGIELISELCHDPVEDIAVAATDVAVGAIHPILDDPLGGEALGDLVAGFQGEALGRVRREVEKLINLRERFDETQGEEPLLTKLKELRDRLPAPTPLEALRLALQFRTWDFDDRQLAPRIEERLAAVSSADRATLLEELRGTDVPAALELGMALAAVEGKQDWIASALVSGFAASPNTLIGYLAGLVKGGDDAAFDEFLDSTAACTLDRAQILDVAVRGPDTDAARDRVRTLTQDLSVAEVARALFAWRRHLVEDEMLSLAAEWLERLETQSDYDALVDWVAFYIFDRKDVTPEFEQVALGVIEARRRFPEIGRQNWDWAQIIKPVVSDHAAAIAALLFELVDSGQLMILQHEYEAEVLAACAAADPDFVWREIGDRLEAGSWRIQMEVRGWLVDAIPMSVIVEWVGEDVERARLVASIATSRVDNPTDVARFLLTQFAGDDQVRSDLAGALLSGSWSGPESLRLEEMIEKLTTWRSSPTESEGVRDWAGWMVEGLKRRREQVLEREAEGDW